jgi:hypothetical protein
MLIRKLITACCKNDRQRQQTASVAAQVPSESAATEGQGFPTELVSHGWWTFRVWEGTDRGLCHGTTRNSCVFVLRKITKNWRQRSLVGMPSEIRTGINKLINAMGQSPSLEVSQEIPGALWSPTVHYRVHNSTPLIPILSRINPFPSPILFF